MKINYNHAYSKFRSNFINKILDQQFYNKILRITDIKKGDKILEIGCNTGELLLKLEPLCKKVVGVDINENALRLNPVKKIYKMNAENLKFKSGTFSKIVSLHTIEHVRNIKKTFKEMSRILKPKGEIILVYPYELIRGMTCIGSALFVYKNPFATRKMHIHKLNPSKIKKLATNSKLLIKKSVLYFTPWPIWVTILIKS